VVSLKTLFLLLFLAAPCWAQEALIGRQGILHSGPHACKNSDTVTWKNDTGRTLHIKMLDAFTGMGGGSKADFSFGVTRSSDGTLLAINNWDHYAEPTSQEATRFHQSFSPDYIELSPTDSLSLEVGCMPYSRNATYEVAVSIWYSFGPMLGALSGPLPSVDVGQNLETPVWSMHAP
jgi:hypothetical protein